MNEFENSPEACPRASELLGLLAAPGRSPGSSAHLDDCRRCQGLAQRIWDQADVAAQGPTLSCIDAGELLAELRATMLADADLGRLLVHATGCAQCRGSCQPAAVDSQDRDGPQEADGAPVLETPSRWRQPTLAFDDASGEVSSEPELPIVAAGNFELEEELARGGMGRVFRAWDRRLKRWVAIKVVLPRGQKGWAERQQIFARFRREARLTAGLEHPSIVGVHEAGRWSNGEPFFAMRLVSGRPLGEVCNETRTLADRIRLLPVVIAVADALAYAHSKEIIHRDLKPSNVLVGEYGETVVIDWGLAKSVSETAAAEEAAPSAGAAAAIEQGDEPNLTVAGAVLGTLGYIPPEQAAGEPVGRTADVYALGALLYHVLTGVDPFHGSSSQAELLQEILDGSPEPISEREPRIPAELAAIVEHAMAREPGHRYPAAGDFAHDLRRYMDGQLVRAHAYGKLALAWRWLRGHRRILGAALAAACAAGIALQLSSTAPAALCQDSETRWSEIWDHSARAKVERAFALTGRADAKQLFQKVSLGIQRVSGEWVTMHRDACEATHIRGEQSGQLLDLRMQCLDDRLSEIRTLTAAFAEPWQADDLTQSTRALDRLAPLAACADKRALLASEPLPAAGLERRHAERLAGRMHEAKAAWSVGRFARGGKLLEPLLAEMQVLGHLPLRARGQLLMGKIQRDLKQLEPAETALRAAIELAARAQVDAVAAVAWPLLLHTLVHRTRYSEAMALIPAAEAAILRAGDGTSERAALLGSMGHLFYKQGRLEDALRYTQQALALRKQSSPAKRKPLADSWQHVGIVLKDLGRTEEAMQHYQAALAILKDVKGPTHPSVGFLIDNMGRLKERIGEHEESRELHRQALAILEPALGPEHADLGYALTGIGVSSRELGDLPEARRVLERALTIRRQALGPNHMLVAESLRMLALIEVWERRLDQALDHHQTALALFRSSQGPRHPDVGESHYWISQVLVEQGKMSAALEALSQARTFFEPEHSPAQLHLLAGHIALAQRQLTEASSHYRAAHSTASAPSPREKIAAITGLGKVALAQRRPREARARFEEAVALPAGPGLATLQASRARMLLARSLWTRGGPAARKRARKRAGEAEKAFRDLHTVGRRDLKAATAWLRKTTDGHERAE